MRGQGDGFTGDYEYGVAAWQVVVHQNQFNLFHHRVSGESGRVGARGDHARYPSVARAKSVVDARQIYVAPDRFAAACFEQQ